MCIMISIIPVYLLTPYSHCASNHRTQRTRCSSFYLTLLLFWQLDLLLVLLALLLQLIILVLDRSHDGLNTESELKLDIRLSTNQPGDSPSCAETVRRVDNVERILLHAKLASEVSLIVEVAGPDDALVGM